jgi:ATP-dependent DNA helicase RecG
MTGQRRAPERLGSCLVLRTLHCAGEGKLVVNEADVRTAIEKIVAGATADAVESRTLDFKRQGRSQGDVLKDIAEAAACFANSHGGSLVVGVRDRPGGPEALEGTDLEADAVLRHVYELTSPPLTVDIAELTVHDVRLLVVRVPRSPEVHQVDGRSTRRVGTSCERMTAAQIAGLLAERRGEGGPQRTVAVPCRREPSRAGTGAVAAARRSGPRPARLRH